MPAEGPPKLVIAIKRSFRLKMVSFPLDRTFPIAEVGYVRRFQAIAVTFVLSISSSLALAEELPSDYDPGEPASSSSKPDLTFFSKESLAANFDDLSVVAVSSALQKLSPSPPPRVRGAKEITLFRDISPSVVLIVTKDGLGSGSVVSGEQILTNWHVVGESKEVGIIYKPADNFARPESRNLVRAEVIKTDRVRDLALLRPLTMPPKIRPIEIATQDDIEVGSDVHAIGHPSGEAWTYTKGFVSQVRRDFKWESSGVEHVSTVIQTQTPINPGNSGGPLLSDQEKLVGVNSFKAEKSEGLNFAVSAAEVQHFLRTPAAVVATRPANPTLPGSQVTTTCDAKASVTFAGRNKDNTAYIRKISVNCDGHVDVMYVAPDDQKHPAFVLRYTKEGKRDGIIYDHTRSGKWDISYWDPDLNETFPVVGRHPDGGIVPTTYEMRCPGQVPAPKLQCIAKS
jgi:S1-C subfamily serine protease